MYIPPPTVTVTVAVQTNDDDTAAEEEEEDDDDDDDAADLSTRAVQFGLSTAQAGHPLSISLHIWHAGECQRQSLYLLTIVSVLPSLPYRCGVPCCASPSRSAPVARVPACTGSSLLPASETQLDDWKHHHPPRHRHRLALAVVLQRSAPLYYLLLSALCCPAPRCLSVLSSLPPTTPARQIVLPHYVRRAGTRGPVTFTCSRSVTPVSSLLLLSTVFHHACTRRLPLSTLGPPTTHSTLVGLFLADSKH